MKQQLTNLVRLGVTALVGYLAAVAARQGFHLSPAITTAVTGALLVPAMYLANGLANWLSAHVPWLGHVAVRNPSAVPAASSPRPAR